MSVTDEILRAFVSRCDHEDRARATATAMLDELSIMVPDITAADKDIFDLLLFYLLDFADAIEAQS